MSFEWALVAFSRRGSSSRWSTRTELWEDVNYDQQSHASLFRNPARWAAWSSLFSARTEMKIDYTNDRLGTSNADRATRHLEHYKEVAATVERRFIRSWILLRVRQIFNAAIIDARLTWQFNLRSFLRLDNPEHRREDAIKPSTLKRLTFTLRGPRQTAVVLVQAESADRLLPGLLRSIHG